MRLAVQDGMLPGRSLTEKLDNAASLGFEGVELWGTSLLTDPDPIVQAFDGHDMAVSTICAGYGGCLLSPEKAERDRAVADMKQLLTVGGELGAVGLIFVPVFGRPQIADLSPYKTAEALERDLLVELLGPLAEHAAKAKCLLLLESLNRYETHLVRTLADAARIVRRVNRKGLAMMADLFHMHLEEDDPVAAIKATGRHIRHVHLADSQRLQPGTGHSDFRAAFRALKRIGFKDYMALECGIRGPKTKALKDCVRFLKRQMP
jgi:sugar phosphate isomerase/epimerase